MLVDTHTHVVSGDLDSYPLSPRPLSGRWYLESPCSTERLLEGMDAAGVGRAVLVQPVGAYSFDNSYAADSAEAHPYRLASACVIDPGAADSAETLAHWLDDRAMQGVRFFEIAESGVPLSDPSRLALWEQADASGARIIVTILEHRLHELASVLDRFDVSPVSLDHCGFCDVAHPEPLLALARFENLHLKITSIVIDAAIALAGTARPFIQRLAGAFGAERLMWGSDFGQTHDRSYPELVRLGIDAFGGLSSTQQQACLGGTALRLWFPS